MAQQTGILGLRGTVGGLVFRSDGSVSAKPASRTITQVRTLENNSEFGLAARYGKLLRNALRSVIDLASDRYMVSRLTKKMSEIIKLDDANDRGQRVYDSSNSAPLVGFEFNTGASTTQVFLAPYSITAAGADVKLEVPAINPLTDVKQPQGATHYELVFDATSLDMETQTVTAAAVAAPFGIQPVNGPATANVVLTASFPAAPAAANLVVGVVGIRFYQQVNGKFYPLNNNSTNALAIEFVA